MSDNKLLKPKEASGEKDNRVHVTLPVLASLVDTKTKDISLLEIVDLSNKHISQCDDFSPLKALKRIDIRNNLVENAEFLRLNIELRWINLQQNQIQSLQFLTHLHQLTVLNLSCNKILTVSHLHGLKQLNTLVLSHNQITILPDLEELVNLKILLVSHNTIEEFKAPKKPLANLKKISISHNKLHTFPFCDKFPKLQELRLNSNKLTTLPAKELIYMNALTILDVGNNAITNPMHFRPLQNLIKLQNLNFSKNLSTEQTLQLQKEFSQITSFKILNGRPIRKFKSPKTALIHRTERPKNISKNDRNQDYKVKKIKKNQ